jgi:hypothetical protein
MFLLLFLTACGQNFYYNDRPLQAGEEQNRVLVAIQNPTVITKGSLQELDAFYDIRHVYNSGALLPAISSYAGALPVSIVNMPAEEQGAVFNQGDGSVSVINYSTNTVKATLTATQLGGIASGVTLSRDLRYALAAQQQNHVVSVYDSANGSFFLNLPGVYRVSMNPGATVGLAFVANSDSVYSVVHLTPVQQQQAINNPNFMGAEDCEPQNLPVYCAFAVNPGPVGFDRPTKAVFSSDGSSAYVVDCGPECGGTAAGVTVIPITPSALNPGSIGPAGIALAATARIAVPGGADNLIFGPNTIYVAGQQRQADGLFAGQLSTIDMGSGEVTGQYAISDGMHGKMIFADNNTLWIGGTNCQEGERYAQVSAGNTAVQYGCFTMFNTSTNTATIDSYKGDGTGVAAITGLGKVYVAEGGQVYIYSTKDMSTLNNSNVTVTGTASDVAYMDAPTDDNNATY